MFGRKNTIDKSQQLVRIICKLEALKIGNVEQLEDIKLDLEEDIPLTEQKKEYLRKLIVEFKEHVKITRQNQEQNSKVIKLDTIPNIVSNDNVKIKKHNKKSFSLFKKEKNKDTKTQTEKRKLFGKVFNQNRESSQEMKVSSVNSKKDESLPVPQKKKTFSNFFIRKISKKQTVEQLPDTKNEEHDVENKSNSNKSIMHSIESQVNSVDSNPQDQHISLDSRGNDHTNNIAQLETLQSKLQEYNDKDSEYIPDSDEFQTRQNLELEDIKQIIQHIRSEKNTLQNDIDKTKSYYTNITKLFFRYENLEKSLDSARSGLDAIQSTVYHRLKEIRNLKKELAFLKEELSTLKKG